MRWGLVIARRVQRHLAQTCRPWDVKRAKPRGLKRNAAVVLGNVGTAADADALTRAFDAEERP